MAESEHCEDERPALVDKDAPSMAKYNSRVGRARMANQNARDQAPRQPQPTASQPATAAVIHSSVESDAPYSLQAIVVGHVILPQTRPSLF